jgi:hypothetical protein
MEHPAIPGPGDREQTIVNAVDIRAGQSVEVLSIEQGDRRAVLKAPAPARIISSGLEQ